MLRLRTQEDLSLGQTWFSVRENISCVSSIMYAKLSLMLYTLSDRLNCYGLSAELYDKFSPRENKIKQRQKRCFKQKNL